MYINNTSFEWKIAGKEYEQLAREVLGRVEHMSLDEVSSLYTDLELACLYQRRSFYYAQSNMEHYFDKPEWIDDRAWKDYDEAGSRRKLIK